MFVKVFVARKAKDASASARSCRSQRSSRSGCRLRMSFAVLRSTSPPRSRGLGAPLRGPLGPDDPLSAAAYWGRACSILSGLRDPRRRGEAIAGRGVSGSRDDAGLCCCRACGSSHRLSCCPRTSSCDRDRRDVGRQRARAVTRREPEHRPIAFEATWPTWPARTWPGAWASRWSGARAPRHSRGGSIATLSVRMARRSLHETTDGASGARSRSRRRRGR